jgi:hypothetical protein
MFQTARVSSCSHDEFLAGVLFKLPLQGHFEGQALPIFVPDIKSNARDNKQSSTGSTGCPPGVTPDRLTVTGMLYQPAALDVSQLRSRVNVLRQHLSTQPRHTDWWHLQLSATFDALGKSQHAPCILRQELQAAYDTAASRRLAAAAMYKLAEMRLAAGDMQGAISAASRGVARHVTPDLMWIAALASYRADDYRAAISWSEMAVRVACKGGVCSPDRPAAFVDVDTWYEKPYDVLRWALQKMEAHHEPEATAAAATKAAQRSWADAAVLREQQVAGNSSSRFIVLGLQALPLLQLQGQDEVRTEMPSSSTYDQHWRRATVARKYYI